MSQDTNNKNIDPNIGLPSETGNPKNGNGRLLPLTPIPRQGVKKLLNFGKFLNDNDDAPLSENKFSPSLETISRFVQTLIDKGIVSQSVVDEALVYKRTHAKKDPRLLFRILIEEFLVDREAVYEQFVDYYSFRRIDILELGIGPERIEFIHKTLNSLVTRLRDLATKNKILPFKVADDDPKKLIIITPDPTNPEIAKVARAYPYPKHEICYVSFQSFSVLERALLQNSSLSQGILDFESDEDDQISDELDDEIRKGKLGELVDNILAEAVRMAASDIHFIPKDFRKTEVHFRLDGLLSLWKTLDDIRADAVIAVVKDITKGTDRFEHNLAQDGFIQKNINNKLVRFRVSIIPIINKELRVKSESIVLRVLTDPETSITVENIGFQEKNLQWFKQAIEQPYGMIILTGPTGSGKSTTLLASLRYIMSPTLNILTVEDPVEYFIEGARQVKLNPKLDFEQALRAILRHDPDVVMVGEIRDRITADIAIKLANTGHLTFTTLHTNDAPSAISRLFKMGIEPFLLSSSINAIVAQRLVRKLCDRCKAEENNISPSMLLKIGMTEEEITATKIYRPVGCIECLRGFKGRTAIHEILYLTKEIREYILNSGLSINETAIRRIATDQGMKTLREAAIELLKRGTTSVQEVVETTLIA